MEGIFDVYVNSTDLNLNKKNLRIHIQPRGKNHSNQRPNSYDNRKRIFKLHKAKIKKKTEGNKKFCLKVFLFFLKN